MERRVLIVALQSSTSTAGRRLNLGAEWVAIAGPDFEITILDGVDRQKLEMALQARQYDSVHIQGDGDESVLLLADGLLPESELAVMLQNQRCLRFLMLAVCNGYEIAGVIHNALHIPVVSYNAPIADAAVVEFSKAFYRSWKQDANLELAVRRGREALSTLYPAEVMKVKLLNGDMITPAQFSSNLEAFDKRLQVMDNRLEVMDNKLEGIQAMLASFTPRWLVYSTIILLVLLLIAQCSTPVLNNILRNVAVP